MFANVTLDGHSWPMRGGPRGADGVHAPDGPADPPPVLGVELVQRATAHLREGRVENAVDLVQRRAGAEIHRRDGGHFGRDKVEEEAVLVVDRRARPAAGPVELHDHPLLVLQLDLIHAVLEGAQRQAAPGGAQSADLDGVQHAIGGEREERLARRAHRRENRSKPWRSAAAAGTAAVRTRNAAISRVA